MKLSSNKHDWKKQKYESPQNVIKNPLADWFVFLPIETFEIDEKKDKSKYVV